MVPAGESFTKRRPIRCGFAAADGAFLHKKEGAFAPAFLRIFGLFLRIGDQAVAAVLAAVDDRKGIRVFAVEEGIELML